MTLHDDYPNGSWGAGELDSETAEYVREEVLFTIDGLALALRELAHGLSPGDSRTILQRPLHIVTGRDTASAMISAAIGGTEALLTEDVEDINATSTTYRVYENLPPGQIPRLSEADVPAELKADLSLTAPYGYLRAEQGKDGTEFSVGSFVPAEQAHYSLPLPVQV